MKSIVITSIFEPTVAVESFAKLSDYSLTVVGDKKSPQGWSHPNTRFLSVADQEAAGFSLSRVLPYNHYCRKMIGYLQAIQNGAVMIVDTDDDNIPKEDWLFPAFEGRFAATPENKGFINIYKLYTNQHIWPRGLPLQFVLDPNAQVSSAALSEQELRVGVWQGLADEDPDVDAIYRLVSNEVCYFDKKAPCVLGKGTITPYNSQNTAYRRELFPLLYLPTYVTFRFTDILRGLVAQPIMWKHGYHLGFLHATVVQKRNPHNYMKDFESEVPMFLHAEKVIELVSSVVTEAESIASNLHKAYSILHQHNIVSDNEMVTLDAWLQDIDRLMGAAGN